MSDALGGGLGGLDLEALMQQAQAMQEQMEKAHQAQAEAMVEGSAGGGKVTVTMTGVGEFVNVHIDPDAVDPDDVELLEELVLAALRDAGTKAAAVQTQTMGTVGDDLDLGGLGGMLGLE